MKGAVWMEEGKGERECKRVDSKWFLCALLSLTIMEYLWVDMLLM